MGRDRCLCPVEDRTGISIHSPRMGRDSGGDGRGLHPAHFNPLSPHGERPRLGRRDLRGGTFQSTLPAWGETRPMSQRPPFWAYFNPLSPHGERPSAPVPVNRIILDFNPLSPHGERLPDLNVSVKYIDFNPLSPHGERRQSSVRRLPAVDISIHSPRMGRDRSPPTCKGGTNDFNPLSPHGERPDQRDADLYQVGISIHSPRMGRDSIVPLLTSPS